MRLGLLAGILFATSCVVFCQSAPTTRPRQEFEVATVKVQTSPDDIVGTSGGPGTQRPELLRVGFLTMENLLTQAFGVRADRISAPGWAAKKDAEHYAIEARVPAGASREDSAMMLQNLLIERFGMKFHRERREVAGFELVVAKGGPKLKASAVDPDAKGQIRGALPKDRNGVPQLPPDVITIRNVGTGTCLNAVVAGRQSMDALADQLGLRLKGTVLNKTGLTGVYDFGFLYAPADIPPGSNGSDICDPASPAGPSLFSAIQQELGLRLESKKVSVEIVVIDQLNKIPTEN